MDLFTGVQHLYTFNIVALLIYHLLPNVWKALYTNSASIIVDVPYWPPYITDKLIFCGVPGPSQWFFHFGEKIVIQQGSKELNCVDLHGGRPVRRLSWTASLPSRNALTHRATVRYGNASSTHASRSPWKRSCVLRSRATLILIQERWSSFVNMVLGRSHYPYESQRSTHCSRLTEYCLTVLVHVHKAGRSRTHHRLVLSIASTFYPNFVYIYIFFKIFLPIIFF